MQIRSIQVSCQNLELTRPYTISYKTVSHVENVIIAIELENGIVGHGAANPSKQVVGEGVTDTLKTLQNGSIERFLRRDIRELNTLLQEVQEAFPESPGAAAAMDIALHDAFAQFLGIPLAAFLGQSIASLPTSVTIGIKNTRDTMEEAREYYDRGFKILKIKLGKSLENDLERLAKLHETYKNKMKIRVDANQGYSPTEVIKFYDKIKSFNIELIEQPLPAKAVNEMKRLPSNIRKMIAADESLVTPADAFRLAAPAAACGIFNIKLMKCGGISPALKIAAIAGTAGIDLMWGCNDESIISITAALHAALSCRHTKYIDLDGSLDLAKDVVKGGFVLKDGYMSVNGLPGLGVQELAISQ